MSSTADSVIGLLSWDYGRPKGGMGRSLQHIAAALRRGGIAIRILAPCPGDSNDHPFLALTRKFGGQMLFSLLLPFRLTSRIVQDQISRLLLPVGPGGVLLLMRPRIPVTAIVYHSYLQQYQAVPHQAWKQIFCPFERRTLSFCHQIICFSDDTKRALIEGYKIDTDVIIVLPHAVNIPPASDMKREDGLCICVARLEERKGAKVILDAWPSVTKQIPHARLVIVGDGVQRKQVDRIIAKLPHVERRTGLSSKEMSDLLHQASIALCPAYLEGFGCACAEAMAAGCAVVASDVDGLRLLIAQGESGVLLPAGDSDAFAQATIGLLRDSEARARLGSSARMRMQRLFDPAVTDAALCSVPAWR